MTRVLLGIIIALTLAGAAQMIRADLLAGKVETLQGDLTAMKTRLAGCEARARNILEDKESDDAVDRIPDHDLRHVPDRWLLPPAR